jgi:hypothetical protein
MDVEISNAPSLFLGFERLFDELLIKKLSGLAVFGIVI